MTAAEALIEIERMATAGFRAAQIAAALTAKGYPQTKNAVIGRARRGGIAFSSGGKPLDLVGMTVGRLTAIGPSDQRDSNGRIMWQCRCECGNAKLVSSSHLRDGEIKSCGCLAREIAAENMRKVRRPGVGRPRRDPSTCASDLATQAPAPLARTYTFRGRVTVFPVVSTPRTYAYIRRWLVDDAVLLGWLPRASAGPWSIIAEWLCDCPSRIPVKQGRGKG